MFVTNRFSLSPTIPSGLNYTNTYSTPTELWRSWGIFLLPTFIPYGNFKEFIIIMKIFENPIRDFMFVTNRFSLSPTIPSGLNYTNTYSTPTELWRSWGIFLLPTFIPYRNFKEFIIKMKIFENPFRDFMFVTNRFSLSPTIPSGLN